MSLISQASHVYAEHGEKGLRRWEERLTTDQRAAMVHEWDQFCAAFKDLSEAMQEVPAVLDRMEAAVAAAISELRELNASSSASPEAPEGQNEPL